MDKGEVLQLINNYPQKMETHVHYWKIVCDWVKVNNMFLNGIHTVKLIGNELWLNKNHINLDNVDYLKIFPVKSYVKYEKGEL